MYKVITLFSSIFCFAFTANSQEVASNSILYKFEVIAGPSFSKNSGYLSEYDSKAGYSFGIGYYQELYKSFSVNVRALYEMKGSTTTYNYGNVGAGGTIDVNDRYDTKLKYLSFYVLPTIKLGRNKNILIGAGGYYSFLQRLSVNSYQTRAGTGEFISETTHTDNKYFHPDHDAGLSFQIGYSFKVSDKSQLMLQVYSNRGLIDLYNPSLGSQRNNTFGLLASFRMR
jgi:hypothetical protein